jgi:dihydrodipicolinate synthase/N-acetylneuraminate lyase
MKFEGIFVPTLVPFNDQGDIAEGELRHFVRWLIDKGVHGIFVNGSTGDASRLTHDERLRVAKISCDEAAGRIPVIAGAIEPNVRETRRVCERYAELGVSAAAVMAPTFYRLSPDAVYSHLAEIAHESPVPVLLYNIPALTTAIDVETVQKLAELPKIVGIKDSSGDIPAMMRMIGLIRPLRPEFSFLTGWDPVLVPMLLIGCDGGTHATGNVIPELLTGIYQAVRAGKIDEAVRIQLQTMPLFDAMLQRFEFPDGFRAAAELRGFSFGDSRQAISLLRKETQKTYLDVIKNLLATLLENNGLANG